MSRDELLGRARRAVRAVAGTAGALGGRVRRGDDDALAPSERGEARPRPAPTPGLPPRVEREPEPDPAPAPPPAEAEVTATQSETVYLPRHARPEVEGPPPPSGPEAEPFDEQDDAGPEPVGAATGHTRPGGTPPVVRPAPAGARRPPSASSTVRDALRPHARFLTFILVVLVAIGLGYFTLRVHHRISESSLESKISQRDHPRDVRCKALQSNGSAWACAIVFRAEAECVIARVSVLGSWSTVARTHRCAKITELVALLPQKTTANGVAADVGQQLGITGLTCRKVPEHEVRWACGLPPAPGGQCIVLREVRWQMWPAQAGGRLCDHFPELETAIRASQGEA